MKEHELYKGYAKGKTVNPSDEKSFFEKARSFLGFNTVKVLWHIATHPTRAMDCFDLSDYAILIGVIAYVVMPLDAIPDIIPIIGLSDDAALVSWAISQFADVMKKYEDSCM